MLKLEFEGGPGWRMQQQFTFEATKHAVDSTVLPGSFGLKLLERNLVVQIGLWLTAVDTVSRWLILFLCLSTARRVEEGGKSDYQPEQTTARVELIWRIPSCDQWTDGRRRARQVKSVGSGQ
ncbi:hypothetical protein C8034_v000965 [Colletotrichum sidae]|uniref:Uncharacterized protein n=2 Tax=Colletotrichum orbiculare species complex TaxID=2707354 RepID=A0A4R8R8X3_COLTR|nr:hypothetical protein CTRI78_v007373 [Colletotrichum trifolii]TEA16717.1 hypothetical protein C8034_v000965 [Colletotrichum sidae]